MGLTEPRTVHAWARRHDDFPAPVIGRERLTLWYWPEVEAWARKTKRTSHETNQHVGEAQLLGGSKCLLLE
jgi:hypothetical protein